MTNTILTNLCSVWSQSPTCRRGFHQHFKIPLARFRYVAKMVVACVVWEHTNTDGREGHSSSVLSFVQTDASSKNLMFDVSLFKANQEVSIHREAKRVLSLPCGMKTEKDIQLAVTALREIPAFSEYPTSMQIHMCRLGWYQRVEPNRVIIREGQRAYNYYFILSGTVVITEWNSVIKSCQTKCMLQRGMEFGEQAVFKKTSRSATVTSRSTTELLCLDVGDIAAIYVCGWDTPISDPQIINFLTSIYFLKDFPIWLLRTNSQALVYQHYRPGKVLVKDSNHSDWFFIVKTGSLTVLKKLENNKQSGSSSSKQHRQVKLHSLLEFAENKCKSRRYRSETANAKLTTLSHKDRTPSPNSPTAKDLQAFRAPKVPRSLLKHVTPTPLTCIYEELEKEGDDGIGSTPVIPPKVLALRGKSQTYFPYQMRDEKLLPLVERHKPHDPFQGLPEVSNPKDTDNAHSTFIKVALLEKGQYFGISSTVFANQPSLSLISNGADCLLLSKQFFLKHCSETTLNTMKENELPYPTDMQLQAKLFDHVEWVKFKSQYYINNVSRIQNLPRHLE